MSDDWLFAPEPKVIDEYSVEGKSIAEIHNLTEETDEFIKPPSMEKMIENVLQDTLNEAIDKMKKEGTIKDEPPPIVASDVFVDPDNDEDLSIHSDVMSVFWKMVVLDKRLIDMVIEEPSLKKVAMLGRNNSVGCWFAFTSKKIANRIADSLIAKNFTIDLYLCDAQGNQKGSFIERTNKVDIEEWRPWKPTGTQTETPYKAEEFFYALCIEGKTIKVYFVPEIYWNEHKKIFDGELNIDHFFKGRQVPLDKKNDYCYTSTQRELDIYAFLDHAKFRENLLFNAYINEVAL